VVAQASRAPAASECGPHGCCSRRGQVRCSGGRGPSRPGGSGDPYRRRAVVRTRESSAGRARTTAVRRWPRRAAARTTAARRSRRPWHARGVGKERAALGRGEGTSEGARAARKPRDQRGRAAGARQRAPARRARSRRNFARTASF
jgi:hypothetical protein